MYFQALGITRARKIFQKHQNKERKKTPRSTHHTKCHIVVPYMEGMGESLKKICRRHGLDMHFKGGRTLKNILVSPKDEEKSLTRTVLFIATPVEVLTVGRNT